MTTYNIDSRSFNLKEMQGNPIINSSVSSQKNLVNALGMNIVEIRENARILYNKLKVSDGVEKPNEEAFVNAYIGFVGLNPKNRNYLTVVDFYPNNKPGGLFYIINTRTNTVEYSNLVGHGSGSRGEKDSPAGSADSYSNKVGSKQSSLGFFMTSERIIPGSLQIRQGLKLTGLEKGINDNARKRALYIHPAGIEQSDGCLTLQYDKAAGKEGEDKIYEQLHKIKNGSIVFSYDSRVFDKYKAQSDLFSENPVEKSGLYIVDEGKTDEINNRIIRNQGEGRIPPTERIVSALERRLFRNSYEKKEMRNRECRWKKKEIEIITMQIGNKIDEGIKNTIGEEKKVLVTLQNNIYKARIGFREQFYKSKAKVRRNEIDDWVSEFWSLTDGLMSEKNGLMDLKKFYTDKRSEYVKWEEESSRNGWKIQDEDLAETKFSKVS